MKTYDNVVGFDYTNKEEWSNFVKEQILPLSDSISKILKLKEYLEELINRDLPNLIKDNQRIKEILLGGVDESGEYKPNSSAKLYKETLGISINPKEWVAYSKQSGIDASEYIKCDFSDTTFLEFIRKTKEDINKLLAIIEINTPAINEEDVKEVIENPEKIIDELKTIYSSLISISANYNYHTFFTINTRCVPRFYIEQAYPKLKVNFEKVAELLDLEPRFIPEIKEEELKKDYTIWGHKELGFADILYKLNGTIGMYFRREGLRSVFKLIVSVTEDLGQEYREKINDALKRINWKFPDHINPSVWGGSGRPYWHCEYEIRDVWLSKCYEIPSWSRYSEQEVEFGGKSLLELFNDISPALFLGEIGYGKEGYEERFKEINCYSLIIEKDRLKIRIIEV